MKTEITPELKARYMALYIGQNVIVHPSDNCNFLLNGLYDNKVVITGDFSGGTHNVSQQGHERIDLCHLSLRSVSSLTDEEKLTLGRKLFLTTNQDNLIDGVTYYLRQYSRNMDAISAMWTDELRALSIALPYMGIPVEDFITAGVVVIRKEGE
jgi:hypothetical protein